MNSQINIKSAEDVECENAAQPKTANLLSIS